MSTALYSDSLGLPKTDPKLWRLQTDKLGKEVWVYLTPEEAESTPQSTFVQDLLGTADLQNSLEPGSDYTKQADTANDAMQKGANYFKLLQDPDSGIFPCQYKGPMFMTIGYIVTFYMAGLEIPEPVRLELIRYIVNTAHPVDGGWGLHSVDKSTCMGTVLNYVSLRLLGLPKDHEVCKRSRLKLHKLGGAIGAPHWAKIYLALLNLYDWRGVNPAPPELWMLPYQVPIHPARWWVHTRAIYLPVGYLSSLKYQMELNPLLEELRSEIYTKPYDSINFAENRNTVCETDLYYPHTKALDMLNNCMVFYGDYIRPNWLLKKSNAYTYELIKKDLHNTADLTIAPVSFAFVCIVTMIEEGAKSEKFLKLVEGWKDVLAHGPQGMCVMGTNGVQVWDCAFFVQYFFVANLAELPEFAPYIEKAYKFLCDSQFDSECCEGSFRDKRKGGWPFSTKTQGYTVADCTAEAMKAIIMVRKSEKFQHLRDYITDERLYEACDVLLSLQNVGSFEYGSFSTYEKIKAPLSMERLNPAEVFGNIMVEYPYVECTDSSVLGLTYFHENYDYKKKEISHRIKIAIEYIKNAQRPDGSWYGSWGVCFTYAGMFALEALSTVGETYANSEVARKACDFFAKKQRDDGGWSESMKSSELHHYVETEQSLVVQSAWVLVGLLLAEYPDRKVIDAGIDFLISRQDPQGKWHFEDIEGVFNHSCAIEYPSYRFLFPIKALGLYKNRYLSSEN
ncbi:Lanosterol synthase (Oxidosqualene--lanosterol cyclase) [Hanseniaspora vineae]